ncbi:MAG: hypothetical protein M1812_001210 [Candelaria pacifica]|nr:MAG: hypothetical protein M1812_001210 [Candelaria pacifica]
MDPSKSFQVGQPTEKYMWLANEYEREVSEKQLLQISKDLNAVIVKAESNQQTAQRLIHILKAFKRTAKLAHISESHRAAACNALCGFLDKCTSSSTPSLRRSDFIECQWLDLFDIYLEQSVNTKSKPMKQVLATLSVALRRGIDPPNALFLKVSAISRLLGILWGKEAYFKVKPALQALAFFIAKRVILVEDLMKLFQSWLIEGQTADRKDVEVLKALQNEDAETTQAFNNSLDTSVIIFALRSLRWLSHHDLAPAAGHLASTFFQQLHEQESGVLRYRHSFTQLPLWVDVLQKSVLYDSDVLENYKYHVFPALFKVNSSDFRSFLESLGLRELQTKSSSNSLSPSAMLLFASLQVGKALGLVKEEGPNLKHEKHLEAHPITLANIILDQLLINSDPATRCSALSILITATSNTKPFTAEMLCTVKLRLPQLHAETDAHFRNDILSTEQQLIDRLRGALSYLSKELGRQESFKDRKKQVALGESCKALDPKEISIDIRRYLDQHNAFLDWYVDFLVSELRPGAPYQRQLSSLNALSFLLRSGLDDQVETKNLSKPAQGDSRWSIHVRIFNATFIRTLLDLLLDPFDDVRNLAATLLKVIPATCNYLLKYTDLFLGRAQSMYQQTGRADHADGVARGFEIMYSLQIAADVGSSFGTDGREMAIGGLTIVEKLIVGLEVKLVTASKNLALAVSVAPVHGEFASVRSILDRPGFYATSGTSSAVFAWRSLHQRILRCCERVWECVRYVLCNDSPEGFMLEDADSEVDVGTKGILSWAWRALKEASILLRVMVARATYGSDSETSILESKDIRRISSLTFDQLTQLRHRGAFSVVSSTFAACCQRCSHSNDLGLAELPFLCGLFQAEALCIPARRYELFREVFQDQRSTSAVQVGIFVLTLEQETITRIRNQGATFTRRSAGIPSLIVGILISDGDGDLVKIAIPDLQKEASKLVQMSKSYEEINLPQVHALNSLRAIFTNTKLVGCSEPFLPDTLRLAINCFGVNVWAIRNCGMMLFQALIERLFGISKTEDGTSQNNASQLSSSLYESYPELTGLLLEILEPPESLDLPNKTDEDQSRERKSFATIEAVFPALEIVRRVGLPPLHPKEVTKLVLHHLGSRTWQIRVAAARTMCVILAGQSCSRQISSLLNEPGASTNARHGRLLCAKMVVLRSFGSTRASSSWKTACGVASDKLIVSEDLYEVTKVLQHWYQNVFVHDDCPYTKSAFLDIINDLVVSSLQSGGSPAGAPLGKRSCLYELLNDKISSQYLEDYHRTSCTWASAPLLRRAVACRTSLKQYLDTNKNIGDFMTTLASKDPDSACGVMDMLACLVDYLAEDSLRHMASAFADVMKKGVSANVLALAATNLAGILETRPLLASASLLQHVHNGVIAIPVNPPATIASLRLRGSALAPVLAEGVANTTNIARSILTLSLMIKLAGDNKKDFPTRYAAVQSLHAVRHHSLKENPPFLRLLLVLYDTLVDDDEEIRDEGAEVASTWLRMEEEMSLMPLAARSALLEFLASRYANSKELCLEALLRLAGPQPSTRQSGGVSADDLSDGVIAYFHPPDLLFETAKKEDTSLFVEEKQNLFVDEGKEAESWACVLRRCCPSTVSGDVRVQFETWLEEGLSVMLESIKSNVDGPLGWTTKPEIFLLGIRFILGADVIMQWARSEKNGISRQPIRTTLEKIASHGQRNAMNGSWQRHLEMVLTRST